MNLSYFASFVEIANKGSFSEAARSLNFSQPALSFQIQALEKIYGETLFDRSGNKIRLTEAGKVFLPYAKELVRTNKHLIESLAELEGRVAGKLALGASTIPGEYILPKLLGEFITVFPEVEPSMEIADTGMIINKIRNHEIDLGFVGTHPSVTNLQTVPFADDELVFVCPPHHRLSKRSTISAKEALKEAFILREEGSGTRATLEKALRKRGLSIKDLKIVMELGSSQAIITAVESGLGVAVVSCWSVAKELALSRLVSLKTKDLDLSRQLFLIYNKELPLTRIQKEFIAFIKTKIPREGSEHA